MNDVPQPEYSPKMKREIRDHLYHYLYDPVDRAMQRKIKNLVIQNSKLKNSAAQSFRFRGEVYRMDPDSRTIGHIPPLDSSLHAEMRDYLKSLETLNFHEIPYVLGFINQALNASDDLQDYRRILPENLHPPLDNIISKCLCRQARLPEEAVEEIRAKNEEAARLLRQRLARNLVMK